QGRQHAGRKAEVEADAVDVAPPDAGAGRDEQLVVGECVNQLFDDRQDGVPPTVHDRVAADLHDLQPGQELDDGAAGGGQDEVPVEEGLAHQGRGNVDGFIVLDGHGKPPRKRSVGGDDGPDVLAVEGALDEPRLQAVDHLHGRDVAGMAQEIEHRAFDHQ